MSDVKRPKEGGRKDPLTTSKVNGQMHNPPVYEEMGGFSKPSKWATRSPFKIKPVGSNK